MVLTKTAIRKKFESYHCPMAKPQTRFLNATHEGVRGMIHPHSRHQGTGTDQGVPPAIIRSDRFVGIEGSKRLLVGFG